jgi:oligosaccharyltransferase complex subunit beta
MRSLLFIALALFGLISGSAFAQENVHKTKVLVVLDSLAIRDTHSLFFSDLEKEGYNLDFKLLNYEPFKLQEFGEYNYDQLILFCTSVTDPKLLKNEKILEFFDSGRNILIAGDIDTSKNFRSLVNQLGVDFDPFGTKVHDDIKKVDDQDNGLFFTDNQVDQPVIALQQDGGILYRGIGLSLSPYENFQVYGLLRGTEYTYSSGYKDNSEEIISTGSRVVLAAGVQGRNNARAIITGSLDMFSNELFVKSNGTNRKYTIQLAKWNFGESGVLRVNRIYHHFAKDSSYQPSEYKLFDDIVYYIDITTWDSITKQWVPYVANDIYMEFVMLDPYIRMPLTYVSGTSTYKAEFKIPDKHGVFQFKVDYKKPGYTFVQTATKIPIRPFKHNEYERFLFDAFPYYMTVFGTLIGFFVFVTFFPI